MRKVGIFPYALSLSKSLKPDCQSSSLRRRGTEQGGAVAEGTTWAKRALQTLLSV